MATIFRDFAVDAPPEFVWAAIKDVGGVHIRLARGFVTDTVLAGDTRTVTFANGFVVQERIVAVDDEHMRLVYSSVGGRASHHNASFRVFPCSGGGSKVVWITDLLPDAMRAAIEQMVELGSAAIRQTLEQSYRESR